MQPYEKLGLLYLGRQVDRKKDSITNIPFLYKNKNLTTHGLIIGMTGSGKTGLGISLIEEAIMDNVPSIIIDPKGDMGNLALQFPECSPEDFLSWMDPAQAESKNISVEKLAHQTSDLWKKGMKSWDQDIDRIAALQSKTDITIYTPGSTAGTPVSVLAGFTAPAPEVMQETDTVNSMVSSAVSSLLALIDISGDPLQSKEHILLSSLLLYHWRKEESPTLENLISGIVSPPFTKVGVFNVDTFYPQSNRMTLAMKLNNILASPGFSSWLQGQPLDIQKILYTDSGKPRTAIFSISHLSDSQRMFFVTMLLNQFIGWMRKQQGSSSLKAMLYMDEIFGYFPPIGEPPSKKPMILLLKQARAFGIGVILATQNPVDIDYKGLSNIGTWFIGKLQTRQDQNRVVEGIVNASNGKLTDKQVRKLLSDMKTRRFLLHSTHQDEPFIFETRWVMSYLKGPMSKQDIAVLTNRTKRENRTLVNPESPEQNSPSQKSFSNLDETSDFPPPLPEQVEQRFNLYNTLEKTPQFVPWLGVSASIRYYNAKRNIDIVEPFSMKLYLEEKQMEIDWNKLEETDICLDECTRTAPENSRFFALPPDIAGVKNFKGLSKDFSDHLYQHKRLELFHVKDLKLESRPKETLADFKIRLADVLREKKQEEMDALEAKYKSRQERLETRLEKAFIKLDKEEQDVKSKTADSLISFGTAMLGAFFGRKAISTGTISRTATGIRHAGKISREKEDVRRAKEAVQSIQQDLEELSQEIQTKIEDIADSWDAANYNIDTFAIRPRRADIFDVRMLLLWDMAL